MLDVLLDPIRKTFVYSGRATRLEYWGTLLALFLVLCVLSGVEVALYDDVYLSVLYMFVAILPILSLSVRRLHDTGHSGIWVWLCLIVNILLILFLPPNRRFPMIATGYLLYMLAKKLHLERINTAQILMEEKNSAKNRKNNTHKQPPAHLAARGRKKMQNFAHPAAQRFALRMLRDSYAIPFLLI